MRSVDAMRLIVAGIVALSIAKAAAAANAPTRQEAAAALREATAFFHLRVSKQGGYDWRYSSDLKLSEGEGRTSPTMIWVQPPGTPAVGMAFLDAFQATGDHDYLAAARETAGVLVKGQLQSGGWYYHIVLDAARRRTYGYRDNPEFRPRAKKKNRTNITTLDDDTTQSVVRFLMRLDKTLDFKNEKLHEAVLFALDALRRAQYPNGGWYQNWDKHPTPATAQDFPIAPASYPKSWPREWQNDWTGRYFINDNVMSNMIVTMLDAWEIYKDRRYLDTALRAGVFLIRAQMPDPQPAWAQQYNVRMHPVWDRKFEPPAVTGGESQQVMRTLMLLYRKSGKRKYLEPIPRAVAYLRASQLPGGRLARFYELRTNKPLYFKRTGKRYDLTYSSDDLPTHYSFIVASKLNGIEAEYKRLLRDGPTEQQRSAPRADRLASRVRQIIDALDERGAWVEKGTMKTADSQTRSGIIQCRTFIENAQMLCRYLDAIKWDRQVGQGSDAGKTARCPDKSQRFFIEAVRILDAPSTATLLLLNELLHLRGVSGAHARCPFK